MAPVKTFLLGALGWLVWWWKMPRLDRAYVFAHEATHALAVWSCGGKVRQFFVGKDSGHVIIDRSNFWISLAPYIVPLYALVVAAVAWGWQKYTGTAHWPAWGWPALGATLAFHLTYTLRALRAGQTDLSQEGVSFSLPIIVIGNGVWMLLLAAALGLSTVDRYLHCWMHYARALVGHVAGWF